ncbi:MAG: hypothetical protein MJE77_22340 [Proteobacteria bacterium]|nr:hypothetical protein [Pseudomonadota bacterium]
MIPGKPVPFILGLAALWAISCGGSQTSSQPVSSPATSANPDSAAQAPVEQTAEVTASPDPADNPAPADATTGSAATVPVANPVENREELAEKMLAMARAMTDAAINNQGKCDDMAAAIKAIVNDNRDLVIAARQFDNDPEAKKWLAENYQQKFEEAVKPMMEPAMACADNPAMQEAFQDMQ